MFCRGREIVREFDGAELLFLRYSRQHFTEGHLEPHAIRTQQSINRGLFSEPEDTLFSEIGAYDGFGVVQFEVGEVPAEQSQPNGPSYEFFVVHRPRTDNYSHSEIWSDQKPAEGYHRKPSKTVSMEFRIRLCRLIDTTRIRIAAVR